MKKYIPILLMLAVLIVTLAGLAQDSPKKPTINIKEQIRKATEDSASSSFTFPPVSTNSPPGGTNAPPVPFKWELFRFNTNWLAAHPELIARQIIVHRRATNAPPNLSPADQEFYMKRMVEINEFTERALTTFRDGLATNTYGTNFGEFAEWARTNGLKY